ncbi:MAG: phosphate/phosphite/phosphonate ABC transporter substrate-binding protein [Gammaproteobacteria bacterium]|nr:phosphate/phosphite/phosphonate ABC transporter substrate-binding protein [Gammaproteobacteria bacterium]
MADSRRAFCLLLCGVLLFSSGLLHAERAYRFGVVPQFEPRHLARIWNPILVELERRTGLKLHLSGSINISTFERDFRQGRFDFVYMNPYHALIASEQQAYQPLVRDGGRSLFGILLVAKTSPITSIQELNEQKVLFPSPNALGASLLMRAELGAQGISVKPHYVKTHSSVYTNLLLGRAVAGGGVVGTLKRQKQVVQDNLRILYWTHAIAPHPVMVHPRVSQRDREAVKQAFLAMGESKTGRALLAKVPIKKIILATMQDYAPLKGMGLENYVVQPQ